MDLINKCVLKWECLVSTCELVLPAANICPHVTPCQARGWRGREDPITAFYSDVILPFAIQSSTYLIHCPALSSLYEWCRLITTFLSPSMLCRGPSGCYHVITTDIPALLGSWPLAVVTTALTSWGWLAAGVVTSVVPGLCSPHDL